MSLKAVDAVNAETRFRQAFDRIKNGEPKVLVRGAAVTQNNVAREAGCDPSALKKSRFPALVREIQAYVDLRTADHPSQGQAHIKLRSSRRTLQERLDDALKQRDMAQSLSASANRRIVELTLQVQSLRRQIDELAPPPTVIRRS
jgi:small-conductance mechanosensitive channel